MFKIIDILYCGFFNGQLSSQPTLGVVFLDSSLFITTSMITHTHTHTYILPWLAAGAQCRALASQSQYWGFDSSHLHYCSHWEWEKMAREKKTFTFNPVKKFYSSFPRSQDNIFYAYGTITTSNWHPLKTGWIKKCLRHSNTFSLSPFFFLLQGERSCWWLDFNPQPWDCEASDNPLCCRGLTG
jgi:hypothetical protein